LASPKRDLLSQLYWEVARVHVDRRDLPQTMAACKQLGTLAGSAADGHACAADAHLLWQRATEALTETAAALASDPRCYEAKVAEGRAFELELDAPKAEASFRAAISLRADGVDAHLGLGRLLWKASNKSEGVTELRKALQLDPNGPEALYELGLATAPGDESMTLLDRATRERASFPEAWLALGAQQFAAGRLSDAKRAAEAAVRDAPGNGAAHVLLGKLAFAEGRVDDAIKEAEAALKILPNSAGAKLLVADGNVKKGELDRALEAYQAAWGLDHSDPTPLVHASEACHSGGRDTSARAFGAKATQEFPKWAPGWAALGDALAGQGEKVAAREAYRKALAAGEGTIDASAVQKKLAGL
jgi:tetratricopeptide (TPR) repeat protein